MVPQKWSNCRERQGEAARQREDTGDRGRRLEADEHGDRERDKDRERENLRGREETEA